MEPPCKCRQGVQNFPGHAGSSEQSGSPQSRTRAHQGLTCEGCLAGKSRRSPLHLACPWMWAPPMDVARRRCSDHSPRWSSTLTQKKHQPQTPRVLKVHRPGPASGMPGHPDPLHGAVTTLVVSLCPGMSSLPPAPMSFQSHN